MKCMDLTSTQENSALTTSTTIDLCWVNGENPMSQRFHDKLFNLIRFT